MRLTRLLECIGKFQLFKAENIGPISTVSVSCDTIYDTFFWCTSSIKGFDIFYMFEVYSTYLDLLPLFSRKR